MTSIHAALDALAILREKHGLKPEDIAGIHAGVSKPTHVHCAWPYKAQSITAAQMNIYYGLAMIAFHGRAFTDQFTDAAIRDPDVLAFIEKISAEVDSEIETRGPAFRHMARVRVTTTAGKTFEETVTHRKGSPENPLTPDEVEAKYTALAGSILSKDAVTHVRGMVFALDTADEVESLTYAISGN